MLFRASGVSTQAAHWPVCVAVFLTVGRTSGRAGWRGTYFSSTVYISLGKKPGQDNLLLPSSRDSLHGRLGTERDPLLHSQLCLLGMLPGYLMGHWPHLVKVRVLFLAGQGLEEQHPCQLGTSPLSIYICMHQPSSLYSCGASVALWGCISPDLAGKSGSFLHPLDANIMCEASYALLSLMTGFGKWCLHY